MAQGLSYEDNEPLHGLDTQTFDSGYLTSQGTRRCCCGRRRRGADNASTQLDLSYGDLPANPAQDLENGLASKTVEDLELLRRHTRRWTCLVRWCCPTRAAQRKEALALKQQQLVTQHLAAITTQYFRSAPPTRVWVRGFRELRVEVDEEDARFFENRAPPADRWEDLHKVLDLGISGPSDSASFGASMPSPPLVPVALAAAHFARFATAAYGRGMYMLMKPLTSCLTLGCCTLSEQGGFKRISGIAVSDVLHASTRAEPFKPAWWLSLDRLSRSVVVSVRGTFGTSDVISDLLVRQVQFRQHSVHQGMLTAARWLRAKLLPLLAVVPELAHGEYRLVTTGHSLGGGVAALLAWLLREEGTAQERYRCLSFVYGAPLLCDLALAEKMRSFVVSIVHNKDMVPRMSLRTLEDLRDRVSRSAEPAEERLLLYEQVLERFHVPKDPEALARALERGPPDPTDYSSFRTAPDIDQLIEMSQSTSAPSNNSGSFPEAPTPPLYGPGWQLHLRRRTLRTQWLESRPILRKRSLRKFLIAAWTPPMDFFQMMRPAISMWTDHFPHTYLYVCQVFYERLCDAGGPDLATSSMGTALTRRASSSSSRPELDVHLALGAIEQYLDAAYCLAPAPAEIGEKDPAVELS